ncbi:LysM domain-containing protein [Heracleum sosnowskyi]|uniref:LysM domain-containing protein n=1 Tax=Heracleum sosnowskyi TaxID=360622 RepID=A0AAD8IVB4_9APIA|nr:LysM domain-containing protein [Heracleum sosnowskyi]
MKTLVPSFDSKSKKRLLFIAVADEASLYCAVVLVALFLLVFVIQIDLISNADDSTNSMVGDEEDCQQPYQRRHVCDEIYVVEEGETLQSISNKCRDSYIVERNPHIHDPDDVFPGLLIKIIPS